MKRWRTVGLIGVPTADGRIIEGTVSLRSEEVVILRRRKADGHQGVEPGQRGVPVRIRGPEIVALLSWRDRHATPGFMLPPGGRWLDPVGDGPLILRDPILTNLGPGPSAWAELR